MWGINIVKKYIKTRIKKTGTYRVLEIEKNNLEDKVQKLNNDKENQKEQIKKLNNDKENQKEEIKKLNNNNGNLKNELNHLKWNKKDLELLSNNLKAENESLKQIYLENFKEVSSDYSKLTIIIPYGKTDDPEREENVDITLRYLSKLGLNNIIISEHSNVSSKKSFMNKYGNIFDSLKVVFSNKDETLFNISHAINNGVIESKTPYFAIVDIDAITKKNNIDLAIHLLNKGFEIVYPFNRVIKDIVDKKTFVEDYNFDLVESPAQFRNWADGGIVFWNKHSFINIGMENEYFSGWGGEDNEILIRANLCKLKQIRINDNLYHLHHHRPKIRTKNNVEQMDKIRQIKSKEELLIEVNKWPWVINAKNKSL
ncbi:MAG: galactosyltransferase-related protein [Methanobacterium sp.]